MASILNTTVAIFCEENVLTTVLVLVSTFLLVFFNTRRRRGVPPGPVLLPIIGNLTSLFSADVLKNLDTLRQKYGDIFGLYVGNELTIFMNGYDVVQDALVKKGSLFVNRPINAYHKRALRSIGIIFANGQRWKEQKSLVQSSLQKLCFSNGGENIENIMRKEIAVLVDAFDKSDGVFDNDHFLSVSVANVILTVVYRNRFNFEDEQFKNILKTIKEFVRQTATMSVLVNCFPFLTSFPGDILKIKSTLRKYDVLTNTLNPFIANIKHDNEAQDTFVGLFYNAIEENRQNGLNNSMTEEQMVDTCYELLATGSETTATTLRWIILYLIRQPDIQDKMFQEILREIGRDVPPALKDRKKLPYVQAVIFEGMRIASAVPLGLPHTASRDLIFHGYVIPQNSTVILNLDSCLKDPSVWKDPDVFRPERFLGEDGTELCVPKQFIPFSLGPRSCPGETLARMELFLFLTTLVQKFEFHFANAGCIPSTNGHFGITWYPDTYLMKIKKR